MTKKEFDEFKKKFRPGDTIYIKPFKELIENYFDGEYSEDFDEKMDFMGGASLTCWDPTEESDTHEEHATKLFFNSSMLSMCDKTWVIDDIDNSRFLIDTWWFDLLWVERPEKSSGIKKEFEAEIIETNLGFNKFLALGEI